MTRFLTFIFGALLAPALLFAGPGKPDITVMTQNQYLGADLTPITSAVTPEEYAEAVLDTLAIIAQNNIPERAEALARAIVKRKAQLVGLQEVFEYQCIPEDFYTWPDPNYFCAAFSAAMNDHLQLTLDALADLGADYAVAAVVDNLIIDDTTVSFPGLPVFIDDSGIPAVYITVRDRDVILARSDVPTVPVAFDCPAGKFSADGCNYVNVAAAPLASGDVISVERGFVAVDAMVKDKPYRFVNTHLEVRYPSPDPFSAFFQAAQASELMAALALTPPAYLDAELLVVGDINSAPEDPVPPYPFVPPYHQMTSGMDFLGNPLPFSLTDTWNLRPGNPKSLTCCQLDDFSNHKSILYERIDVIFSLNPPSRVKAKVLGDRIGDKTASGLWPSDHASVSATLSFD